MYYKQSIQFQCLISQMGSSYCNWNELKWIATLDIDEFSDSFYTFSRFVQILLNITDKGNQFIYQHWKK